MKKFIPLMIITLATLTACDSPRSQRASAFKSNNNALTNNGGVVAVNLDNNNSSTISTTVVSGTTSLIPADAALCKFSSDGVSGTEITNSHIGNFTLCQSTDKNSVYFQLQTSPNTQVCFLPTTSSGANAIHVGNPMCGYFYSKEIRKINFVKYAQYADATITGVIFFKDSSWTYPTFYNVSYQNGAAQYYPVYNRSINTLDAYKLCRSMLTDINNSLNCTYFKNVGQYVYKQF